jgi:hypothetical protein
MNASTLKGLHPRLSQLILTACDNRWPASSFNRLLHQSKELRALLRRHNIAFDERYVWD